MDLYILNTNLQVIDLIDSYESLIWTDRYWSYGDFELYTQVSTSLIETMKIGYYIRQANSDHVMIIESVEIESDAENGDKIKVTGRSLESILERRIIWKLKTISGNLQNSIKTLLNECIISPSISARKISNFIFEASTDTNITSLTATAEYTGDNLYDVISTLCMAFDLGFQITLNDTNQFVFKLYKGTDRSYEQTANPFVIFSPKFENVINSNYYESNSNLKNVTLIGGEGEGTERVYATYQTSSVSGLDRREYFTDARDISSQVDSETTLSSSEYEAMLVQRGTEKLEDYKKVITFEGEVETTVMFKYGEDFFNGDVVQIANEYGHENEARIIEIVFSDDTEGSSVYPTFLMLDTEEDG